MEDFDKEILADMPAVTAFLQHQLESIAEHVDDLSASPLPSSFRRRTLRDPLPLMIIALDEPRDPLVFDLYGGVVLGYDHPAVDIDLTAWDAHKAGVSREHALLRPRPDHLYVIDTDSKNGTYRNGLPLNPSRAYELHNNDILTLGRLHIGVHIL